MLNLTRLISGISDLFVSHPTVDLRSAEQVDCVIRTSRPRTSGSAVIISSPAVIPHTSVPLFLLRLASRSECTVLNFRAGTNAGWACLSGFQCSNSKARGPACPRLSTRLKAHARIPGVPVLAGGRAPLLLTKLARLRLLGLRCSGCASNRRRAPLMKRLFDPRPLPRQVLLALQPVRPWARWRSRPAQVAQVGSVAAVGADLWKRTEGRI